MSDATISCFEGAFETIGVDPTVENLEIHSESPVFGQCADSMFADVVNEIDFDE